MKAEIDIEIDGPVVDGAMRGVKFIETGFTQTILPTKWHADYDQLPKVGEQGLGRQLTTNMEGTGYLDTIRRSRNPWYDSRDEGFQGANGLENELSDESTSATLSTGDTPRLEGTTDYFWAESGVTDNVDRFSMVFDFEINLTVRTTEKANDADEVYTNRASADWQFDGSGSITAAGNANNASWKLTGSGDTGDNMFTEVKDGTRFTADGRPFDVVYDRSLSWSMTNQ